MGERNCPVYSAAAISPSSPIDPVGEGGISGPGIVPFRQDRQRRFYLSAFQVADDDS